MSGDYSFYPNIHGESFKLVQGEKQNAVRNFLSDARKTQQRLLGTLAVCLSQALEIKTCSLNDLCRLRNVLGSVP